MSNVSHLQCSKCARNYDVDVIHQLCECGGPLLARYDLAAIRRTVSRESFGEGPASMWRYGAVLPCDSNNIVSRGEGFTPLVHATHLGARCGASAIFIKDEGINPTGTFKARGIACAVSAARQLGIRHVAIASSGNAASALSAYAAAGGVQAHIFVPTDARKANLAECRVFGADITLIEGLVSDCGRALNERVKSEGWLDVSSMKEPYRVEGKKTMAYELAEQFHWRLPHALIFPTGGGVGLIGLWKGFEEMEQLGWLEPGNRPKLIAVQPTGCEPLVRAFKAGAASTEFFENSHTIAAGLRVPKPLADFLVLDYIRASGGTCVGVSDDEILAAMHEIGSTEGIMAGPEGASCLAAYRKLLSSEFLLPGQPVVFFNTGSGLKSVDLID